MASIDAALEALLGPKEQSSLQALEQRLHGERSALAEVLPSLARRFGRARLCGGLLRERSDEGDRLVDLDAWRACDAAGLRLLRAARPDDASLVALWQHGDMEERTILLRCLALWPIGDATFALLGEVQRTNMLPHIEAACCDHNLVARALGDGHVADLNRLVLKLAFLGLPLARALEIEQHANPEFSRMLQDLATEREAAGRAVWPGTCRMIARAPVAGTLARVLGGLEHGDDQQRRAAAEALELLDRRDLRAFAQERLPREPRPEIRAILERCLTR